MSENLGATLTRQQSMIRHHISNGGPRSQRTQQGRGSDQLGQPRSPTILVVQQVPQKNQDLRPLWSPISISSAEWTRAGMAAGWLQTPSETGGRGW
jgi:hypothetical protein